jgi:hypothetical protein
VSALRHEAGIVRAAVRRALSAPSRRALWTACGVVVVVATVIDLVTSGMATRNLGGWHVSSGVLIAAVVGILALAVAVGRITPPSYGTRAADAVWWRYAGIARREGERSTEVIVTMRAFAAVAAIALPLGAAFALAAPDRAGVIVGLALGTSLLAPLSVALSAATAPRGRADGAAEERPAHTARSARGRERVPRGLPAARWLIARRSGTSVVPFAAIALGGLAGLLAPRASRLVDPQLRTLAAVVGPIAAALGAALMQADGIETVRSLWWRTALGTGPRAILAWAVAATLPVAGFVAAFVVTLAAAWGAILLGIAAVPLAFGAPVMLRLATLAVGATFPAGGDRRGAASVVRVAVACGLIAAVVAASLPLAANGPYAVLATATAVCALAGVLALSWTTRQLDNA